MVETNAPVVNVKLARAIVPEVRVYVQVAPKLTLTASVNVPNVCVNPVVQVKIVIGKLRPVAELRTNVATDIALVPPVSVIEPPVTVYVPVAVNPNPFIANVPPLCVTLKAEA